MATRDNVGEGETTTLVQPPVPYRCLTGRPPHSADNINELLYRVAHTRPRAPSSLARVSPAVDGVLAVGLARRAEDRYTSSSSFADALRAALRGDTDATIETDGS